MSYKLSVTQNVICVSGIIDLNNVVEACSNGRALIDTLAAVHVDLSALEDSDSSCLAMLIDWIRCAKEQHKTVGFTKVPRFVLDLGRVCGVDSILPIDRTIEFHR